MSGTRIVHPSAAHASTLRYIRQTTTDRGYPPTVDEVAAHLGYPRTRALEVLNQLRTDGRLRTGRRKARSIELPDRPESRLRELLVGAFGEPETTWEGRIMPTAKPSVRAPRPGVAFMPDAYTHFRDELRTLWNAAGLRRPVEGQELLVGYRFAGAGRRAPQERPDLDNVVKAVGDAGTGWLWGDDRQIGKTVSEFVAWGRGVTPFVGIDLWILDAEPNQAAGGSQ